jgi:hypothetical protein
VVSTETISLYHDVSQLVKEFSTLYELQMSIILECDTALEVTNSSEAHAVSVPIMFHLAASHHNPKDSKLQLPFKELQILSITIITIQSTSPPLFP